MRRFNPAQPHIYCAMRQIGRQVGPPPFGERPSTVFYSILVINKRAPVQSGGRALTMGYRSTNWSEKNTRNNNKNRLQDTRSS